MSCLYGELCGGVCKNCKAENEAALLSEYLRKFLSQNPSFDNPYFNEED